MNYELVCILSPKIVDKEIDKEIDKIDKILLKNKVKNLEKNVWGKKELAYPIGKFFDGYYVQYNFELTPEVVNKIDSKLKLEEKIIRFLIMKQEKVQEVEEPKEKKEKKEIREKKEIKEDNIEKDEKEIKSIKKISTKKKKDESEKDFDKKLDEVLGKDLTD